MSPLLTVLAASVTTFAATNLDDIFLLTVFFARRVPTRRIVAGQYLGFAAIILLSFAGLWAVGLTIPKAWIRLLGILPLGIGIRHLLQIRNQRSTQATETDGTLGVLSIAAITLANGADNIGVYVPVLPRQSLSCVVGFDSVRFVGSRLVCHRETSWDSRASDRTSGRSGFR
jgi:cadmium resistance protein CadD (predicted permease)